MNETLPSPRERVLALIAAEPGLHLREFPRRLGVSLRTVRYHLETMEADGAVVARRSGRFVRFFAPGTFSAPEREAIVAAKTPGSRAVVEALAAKGELAFSEIARYAHLSNGALGWHLRALSKAHVVEMRAPKRYALVDRAAAVMALALNVPSRTAAMEDAAREIFDDPR